MVAGLASGWIFVAEKESNPPEQRIRGPIKLFRDTSSSECAFQSEY